MTARIGKLVKVPWMVTANNQNTHERTVLTDGDYVVLLGVEKNEVFWNNWNGDTNRDYRYLLTLLTSDGLIHHTFATPPAWNDFWKEATE